MTCVLGKYDLITKEVSWVNGGHQPAIIRDKNGKYQEYKYDKKSIRENAQAKW